MRRKRKKGLQIECIAYLSTPGGVWEAEKKEKGQERYIREYARAHDIDIVCVIHRNGLGQNDANRQFESIVHLISRKRVDGVIVANMMAISKDIPDAYYKVGKIKEAGGMMVTVDEGILGMNIKSMGVV